MVAGILLEGRATARIPHILRRCFGSPYAGRAAIDTSSPTCSRATTPSTRRHASDNTYAARTRDHGRIRAEFLASLQAKPSPATEEATSDDRPSDMVRQAERRRSRKRSPDNQRPPPFTDAAVPPVMAGGSRDATPTPRTVHILGNDSKAGFLACELRHVYDSVHVLKTVGDKLVDYKFEPSGFPGDPTTAGAEDKQQEQVLFPTTSETPITKLITTARAVDAVSGIEQLKSRINDQTTLCLMNDGLGVAEELNETIFNEDASAKPEYILGRWSGNYLAREGLTSKGSQTLEDLDQAMDRPSSGNTRGLIHGHPDAAAEFSSYDPDKQMAIAVESALASDLVEELRESPNLNINFIAYHNWLHRKLKEMIFYSVVEPVVAIVDCKYDEVTTNSSAMHMMMMLLEEIRLVIAALPEVQVSARIRMLGKEQNLRQILLQWLRRIKPEHGKMSAHIRWGWKKVDISSHNGYFIRRGKQLGVPTPYNEMVITMIKAKHFKSLQDHDNYIPFEITSRKHGDGY